MLKKVFYQKHHSADELARFLNQLYNKCIRDEHEMSKILLGITQSGETYTVFYFDFIPLAKENVLN